MKSNIQKTYMLGIAGMLIFFSAFASSHSNDRERLAEALNLTPQQQQIFEQLHSEKRYGKQDKHTHHEKMQEKTKLLLMNYSEKKANELAQDIAEKARLRALKRFEHMHQVMEILDSEQRQKLLTMMARKERHKHHH